MKVRLYDLYILNCLLTLSEAIRAYSEALRMTFISAIVFFVIVNILVIPVKLPWLGKTRVPSDDSVEGNEEL